MTRQEVAAPVRVKAATCGTAPLVLSAQCGRAVQPPVIDTGTVQVHLALELHVRTGSRLEATGLTALMHLLCLLKVCRAASARPAAAVFEVPRI